MSIPIDPPGNPRTVIVDDTDSEIVYSGPWFQDKGSHDSDGSWGPAYQSTMHGTNFSASFSYRFVGTGVSITGFNSIWNDSGVVDPTVECFVDNVSIGASEPSDAVVNTWTFCSNYDLLDGPHTLTVNATVNKRQTFWFDTIHYIPSSTVPLDNKNVKVDSTDPNFSLSPGWSLSHTKVGNVTRQNGTTATFPFFGVSLSWYGFTRTAFPRGPASAKYFVDDGPFTHFALKAIQTGSPPQFNYKHFETDTYPVGPHKLVVSYEGDSQSAALTFDYVIIKNGTASTTESTAPASSSTVSTPPIPSRTTRPHGKTITRGAMIGSVVGGLALFFSVFLCIRFLRRQRRQHTSLTSPNPLPFPQFPLSDLQANQIVHSEVSPPPYHCQKLPRPPLLHSGPTSLGVTTQQGGGFRLDGQDSEERPEFPPAYALP